MMRSLERRLARLRLTAVAVAACAVVSCGETAPRTAVPAASYDLPALLEERAAKDAAFRDSSGPLPVATISSFPGLAYFPPDPRLAWSAELHPIDDADRVPIALQATRGDTRRMERVGSFSFVVDGQLCTLYVYRSTEGDPHLFLPFKDATNGRETYEVGRYLDLEELPGRGPYLLDFNRSYNPYCAYNETYSCPIVPPENVLSVPIAAGERSPTWLKHVE